MLVVASAEKIYDQFQMVDAKKANTTTCKNVQTPSGDLAVWSATSGQIFQRQSSNFRHRNSQVTNIFLTMKDHMF
jgi:hypothetical protein